MVLISNALLTNDFKYLFMRFLTMHMSSPVKYLFKYFAHFLKHSSCLTFYYWVAMVLYPQLCVYCTYIHTHTDIHTNNISVCAYSIYYLLPTAVYFLTFYIDLLSPYKWIIEWGLREYNFPTLNLTGDWGKQLMYKMQINQKQQPS